jgi:hypothetical protein
MHEVRATLPAEHVSELAILARRNGINAVSVTDVFVVGPNQPLKLVSVETSTPNAKAFVDAILNSPSLSKVHYSLTSREVRAIISDDPVESLTQPLSEPFPDVIQDLWQLSHITLSYVGRAMAGSIILADGIIENNAISIVLAALFLPFLSQLLALSFGVWCRDWRLIAHGAKALLISLGLAFFGGAIVGLIQGGPIQFTAFRSPLSSFAVSAIVGTTAGLSLADDTGRRYLIGVAAAVQLAVFPVWLGVAVVLGFPAENVVLDRITSFSVNLLTIAVMAVLSFAMLHLKKVGAWKAPRSTR